uniref:protein-tyrosine-phosphatase n=1 Tax=Riptortus pedestris TaxID=329032 RepID=R4WIY6_RIPPE|nr:phosphatase fragment [Riptortus pedestris]
MNILLIRHLYWVLWIWLLLSQANGEDGVAKSKKKLVIKQESGPRGDSLVTSFVQTRVSRAFSSTSTFDDGRGEEEDNKPPDDRQSTIRIRNETVDLSKNTVPGLKYPGPTEPSLKDKYRRTTSPVESSPLKKSTKLKRNMTRPRPADLTTLLAFNALTPSPPSDQSRQSTRARPYGLGGYLSTTQLAESMPPTAWALASLKGPSETTRKPGPPYVKPFVSWSTRLSKPTTTPSPTTEITELVTGTGETPTSIDAIADITAEGVDKTETTIHHTADTTIAIPVSSNIKEESNINIESDSAHEKSQNVTTITNDSVPENTEKPQDITSYKPEENTISVPPLSSLKNMTLDDVIEKSDSLLNLQTSLKENIEPQNNSGSEFNSTSSERPSPLMETTAYEHSTNTSSIKILETDLPLSNTDSSVFNTSITESASESTGILKANTTQGKQDISFENSIKNDSESNSNPELQKSNTVATTTTTEISPAKNNTILIDEEVKKEEENSEDKEIYLHYTSEQTVIDEKRLNKNILATPKSSENEKILIDGAQENVINQTVQDVDPSINSINEKKILHELTTSSVISTLNSSVSVQMEPVVTTPGNINLTNLVEEELKKSGNHFELAKNLPLTSETTTIPSTTHSIPSTPLPVLRKVIENSSGEQDHDILNQTSNYIKPINNVKLPEVSFESNTETTSPRSNEIKHETLESITHSSVNQSETKVIHKFIPDIPETTQSNYIQVQESIKPENKTIFPHSKHDTEYDKQKVVETPPPTATTIMPTTIPLTDIPFIYPSLPSVNISMHSVNTSIPSLNTSIPSMNLSMPAERKSENMTEESLLSIINNSTEAIPTTMETELPTTTTPLPTTTISPTVIVTLPTVLSNTTIPTLVESSSQATQSTTSKSNAIKDQEGHLDINVPIPEKNLTHFQYESPNILKNETTPLIIAEPDDIDDDDVSFNHTYFSDKKNPNDPINTGDNDDDDDGFPDVVGNSSIPVNHPNISNDNEIHKSSTSLTPSTTKATSTTSIYDVIATQTEEEPPIDDDTVYDTGVIMPVYIRMVFDANYGQLCREKDHLRDAIVRIFKKYGDRIVDKRQVVLMNIGLRECASLRGEMNERHTPVHLMVTDSQGQYDKTLNDLFVSLVRQRHLEFKYPITQVEKVIEHQELNMDTESQPSGTVVAAIVISSIAAVCLFALTILLVIMRKRQSGFNYGQRCTPVSLDDYSLDNISVYNSVRRKAMRASKRSYGNPAFDDPDAVTNPVNFAGLANMASDRSKTDDEFSSLPQVVVKPDELPPGAESKNRYANVIPLPETRVQLKGNTPEEQFINANYVKGAKGADKFYIACQAPMQNTIEDFWQMIWDEQCRLVIMLTALTENGKEKCADYLPPSEVLDCHRVFGDLQVTLKKREAREKYVISSLQLKNLETNLWREVIHMWYAGWPATGVPAEPSSVIAFLIEARSYSKGAPVVVHCSPGTGRTGTVIAIDIAIRDFEAGRSVDIPKTVVQVRRGRAGAVQTKDQYHFIYKVLHLYATKLTGGGLDSI